MNRNVLLVALSLLAAPVQAARWVVAPRPHGEVTFKVEGPLDDVTGVTRSVTGTLELDEKEWAKGKGVVTVQLDTLRTGIDQRDQDMRVEFLQTARYPYALLVIDRVDRASTASLSPGQAVQGEALGSFEIHGVRRAMRIPVTLTLSDATTLKVHGAFEVPFIDFGIERPRRLFLKLGETADATFDILFKKVEGAVPPPELAKDAPTPPTAPTVATVQPMAEKAKPRPAKPPRKASKLTLLFAGASEDAKAKGERLFHSTEIGGAGNKLTCNHCHAKTDERSGLVQEDKFVRAASTVWDSAHRGSYWGGMTDDAGKAASICQRKFMLGEGLSTQQQNELKAFLEAISPDPAPPLNYAAFYQSVQSPIRDPIGGNAVRGKDLNGRYCDVCHENARAAPPLQPGLYEPEWVVRRVRWLEGHQSKGCPPTDMTRLTDSDLRDIVTFLTGPATGGAIFNRKK